MAIKSIVLLIDYRMTGIYLKIRFINDSFLIVQSDSKIQLNYSCTDVYSITIKSNHIDLNYNGPANLLGISPVVNHK